MRIRDVVTPRKFDTKTNSSQAANSALAKSLFSAELLQQENEIDGYGREVAGLRKEIETAGEELVKEPTISNFKQFRDILSRLAKRINTEAYRLEKCGGTPQNPRYYEIITTINVEAEMLYKLIIQEQKSNMAITAKVIGIKGLVVDLIT
jgi:uncharacterized protein YaaR (DUF327 family)